MFLSGAHPVKGDRAFVGPTVDQIAAAHVGQDTPLPSIELSLEEVGLNCDANFTCAYRNTLAWKSATLPLPMENNPQVAFERLFGDGSTDAQRAARRTEARSLLDSVIDQVGSLRADLPPRTGAARGLSRRGPRGRAARAERRRAALGRHRAARGSGRRARYFRGALER